MSDDKLRSFEDLVNKDFEAMLYGPEDLDLFLEETIQSMEAFNVNGFYKNLGDKLKKAREEVGLTLAQLGEKFSITGGAIANYEAGIRQVPIHVLIELSRILNKPIHSFLGPQAEPVISIKETLINTLERYTEAEYAKRLMELKDGKLNEVIPQLLIPMPPEICKNHDITIRVKTNEYRWISPRKSRKVGELGCLAQKKCWLMPEYQHWSKRKKTYLFQPNSRPLGHMPKPAE